MTTSDPQAPGFQRRKVGDALVTALNDGFIILPPEILQGVSAEEQDTLTAQPVVVPPWRPRSTAI